MPLRGTTTTTTHTLGNPGTNQSGQAAAQTLMTAKGLYQLGDKAYKLLSPKSTTASPSPANAGSQPAQPNDPGITTDAAQGNPVEPVEVNPIGETGPGQTLNPVEVQPLEPVSQGSLGETGTVGAESTSTAADTGVLGATETVTPAVDTGVSALGGAEAVAPGAELGTLGAEGAAAGAESAAAAEAATGASIAGGEAAAAAAAETAAAVLAAEAAAAGTATAVGAEAAVAAAALLLLKDGGRLGRSKVKYADGGSRAVPQRMADNGEAVVPGVIGNGSSVNPDSYGMILGSGNGRSDNVAAKVKIDDYIVPADVVSALGNGDTNSGGKTINNWINQHSDKATMDAYADGGSSRTLDADLSSGEARLPGHVVRKLGKGSSDKGADMLDKWVLGIRNQYKEHLASLPAPKK